MSCGAGPGLAPGLSAHPLGAPRPSQALPPWLLDSRQHPHLERISPASIPDPHQLLPRAQRQCHLSEAPSASLRVHGHSRHRAVLPAARGQWGLVLTPGDTLTCQQEAREQGVPGRPLPCTVLENKGDPPSLQVLTTCLRHHLSEVSVQCRPPSAQPVLGGAAGAGARGQQGGRHHGHPPPRCSRPSVSGPTAGTPSLHRGSCAAGGHLLGASRHFCPWEAFVPRHLCPRGRRGVKPGVLIAVSLRADPRQRPWLNFWAWKWNLLLVLSGEWFFLKKMYFYFDLRGGEKHQQ